MVEIIKADGTTEKSLLQAMRSRSSQVDKQVTGVVQAILDDVKAEGDAALRRYTLQFDKTCPDAFEVPKEELAKAAQNADHAFLNSLKLAAANIRQYHQNQVSKGFEFTKENGVIMGQTLRGLHKVGLYVPGGTAAYPSTVLMNAIPAKLAGVGELIVITPPLKTGGANPDILAAAHIAGVDRVFLVGGAQGVAGIAYGTQTLPQVDKIVGPGNIYVATAKKLLYGVVDIDMIAGPSEILIIADETANPSYIAADMMSQAEHDPLACSILLTTSATVAAAVKQELTRQSAKLSRKDMIADSLKNYGAIIVCNTMDKMVTLANQIAPEHLEVMTQTPMDYLPKLQNAGSIFLGAYAPEPLGDYFAGTNHVLPTSGTARFFSPLSVDDFIKKSSYIYYTKEALLQDGPHVVRLAQKEGLTAHANSVQLRLED